MFHHRRLLLGALAVTACADPTGSVADTPRVGYVEPASATLVLARPDGSGMRTVPLPGDYRNVWAPRWSPDGERLAVLGSSDAARRELVVVPVASGTAFVTRVVAADPRSALGAIDWSPDGRSLAATFWSYDIHVPPGCAASNAILVTDATPDASPRTVFASQGCGAPLATYGAVSALRWGADRTRLPIPLTFPEDPRIPNDRIRWAQLTADDARVLLALNVEQGSVFGTLLHYHALTPDGGDAGALPGSPVAEPFAVDLRP